MVRSGRSAKGMSYSTKTSAPRSAPLGSFLSGGAMLALGALSPHRLEDIPGSYLAQRLQFPAPRLVPHVAGSRSRAHEEPRIHEHPPERHVVDAMGIDEGR